MEFTKEQAELCLHYLITKATDFCVHSKLSRKLLDDPRFLLEE